MFVLQIFIENLVLDFLAHRKSIVKLEKEELIIDVGFLSCLISVRPTYLIWVVFASCGRTLPLKIEKRKRVKKLISVRNCKNCYVNMWVSRWVALWEPTSAILHCSWCSFVSNNLPLSQQKYLFPGNFFPCVHVL